MGRGRKRRREEEEKGTEEELKEKLWHLKAT